jgi:phospholipid/cholesterol/gamma-HCH transport system ATP-binding protein
MDSAFRIADRMVLLDRGKFIVSGTPEQMRDSEDPLVKQFVHGLTVGPLTDRRRGGFAGWGSVKKGLVVSR